MKVYELNWEFDHLLDMDEDCSVIPFEGLDDFRFQISGLDVFTLKNEIILQGNFNVIPKNTDYPIVDIAVPLMSKKMVLLIEHHNQFEMNKVDTTIIDDTFLGVIFDKEGNLNSNIKKNNDYQFVQVLEYIKAFDYDSSIFKPLRSNPEKIGIINKLVLKEPIHGFPSIFRIAEKPSMLFVSDFTKKSLESNGIKGCVFNEVLVSKGSSESSDFEED
ncbi:MULTISPECIES: imm11 family protein [unclassified Flavobacterium]|uniref:imm11 family protein n=1 Tax=unclassified Flavobacterium TaxID=196869 RepID=UPI00131D252B|nr:MULTISPECIES: DUF1629 domain-containing protein [unclassified Flavobacterium]